MNATTIMSRVYEEKQSYILDFFFSTNSYQIFLFTISAYTKSNVLIVYSRSSDKMGSFNIIVKKIL